MSKSTIAKLVTPLAAAALVIGVARGAGWLGGSSSADAQTVAPANSRAVTNDSAPVRLIDDEKKPADLKDDDVVGTWAGHTDMASGPVHVVIDGINILKPDHTCVTTATILIQIGDPINKNLRIIGEARGTWKLDGGNLKTTTDSYNAHPFNDSDDDVIKSDPHFAQFLAKPPENNADVDAISDWTGKTFTLTTTDPSKPNDPPMVTQCVRVAK